MNGRLIYWVLLVCIAILFLANLLGGDRALIEELLQKDAEVVSRFEEDLETRLKNNFLSPDAVRDLSKSKPAWVILLVLCTGLVLISIPTGAVILCVYLIDKTKGKEWIRKVHDPPSAGWTLFDIFRIAILFVFSAYCISLSEGALVGLGILSTQGLTRTIPIFNTLILDILTGFLVVRFAFLRQGQGALGTLGLVRGGLRQGFALAGVAYISILPIFAILLYGILWFAQLIGYEPPAHPLVTVLVAEDAWLIRASSIFLGICVGPFVEELFFRGFCYSIFKRRWGVWPAILTSSLLFSLVHWNPFSALPIFFLGAALAYLYEKTGSLVASIVMHSMHNAFLMLGLFITKGIAA